MGKASIIFVPICLVLLLVWSTKAEDKNENPLTLATEPENKILNAKRIRRTTHEQGRKLRSSNPTRPLIRAKRWENYAFDNFYNSPDGNVYGESYGRTYGNAHELGNMYNGGQFNDRLHYRNDDIGYGGFIKGFNGYGGNRMNVYPPENINANGAFPFYG